MKNDIHYQVDYGKLQAAGESGTGSENGDYIQSTADNPLACREQSLFWHFPGGKGTVQPWRRKLWILQNKLDRE